MSLMESSKESLRFDEFPTNVARRKSFLRIHAQHAYWLLKTQTTVRVSSPAPKKPARKDSAACVSLSSYHNVKEPFGPEGDASSPNPRWKQITHRESTTAASSRDELRS